MVDPQINTVLMRQFPKEIVDVLVDSFNEVQRHYRIEEWKSSELNAGHFVEAVRRLLEKELFGNYTPLTETLSSFNQSILNKLESASGDEVFRILIPRTLYAIYCIRNKRGVGHISQISPNKLDATFILNATKWVLAELVRFSSTSIPDEAYILVESIMERQIDLVWDDGETFMILSNKLKTEGKILLTLYKKDYIEIEALRNMLQYKNKTAFRRLVEKMKGRHLIDITPAQVCKISPAGVAEAECIINAT
jgi:hypothetical protein